MDRTCRARLKRAAERDTRRSGGLGASSIARAPMVQVPSPVVAAEQTCRVTIFSETQQNEVKFAYALRFGVGARAHSMHQVPRL